MIQHRNATHATAALADRNTQVQSNPIDLIDALAFDAVASYIGQRFCV